MSTGKRILIIVICLLTILSSSYAVFAGIAANASNNGKTVVAKVGKEKIRYSEFYELLEYYMQSWYGVGAEYLDSYFGAEYGNSIRESVIEELIDKKVALQHADEYGLDKLTDDMKTEIQGYVEGYLDDLHESIVDSVVADYTDEDGNLLLTDEEFAEEVEKEEEAFLKDSGYSEEYLTEYYTDYYRINALYSAVTEYAEADENDFREYYDRLLEEQKQLAEEDLESAFMYYDNGYNDVNVYVPGQIKYVKHILIQFTEEQLEELDAIEDETELEKRRSEMLEEIRPEAEAVLARVQNGEDFETVMNECSDDDYKTEEPYVSEGYGVYENSGYVQSFEDASLALKNIGDMTGLVESEFGFHIIKLISIKEAGEIPYEDVRAEIEEIVSTEVGYTAWEEKLDDWKSVTKIKKYEDRYLSKVEENTEDSEDGENTEE